jgi:hypothetical protein
MVYHDITFELTIRFASGSQGGAEWVGRTWEIYL